MSRDLPSRGAHRPTEVLIVAPVIASSRLRDLTDDVDRELDLARNRVEAALQTLSDAGVEGRGRADISEPIDSVLDGLREFPPNEVVIMPGRETRWEPAGALADRLRAEAGLPVTEVSASST